MLCLICWKVTRGHIDHQSRILTDNKTPPRRTVFSRFL
nr:MAG TPA: hypothetical protein [Bacteriophage sp.]